MVERLTTEECFALPDDRYSVERHLANYLEQLYARILHGEVVVEQQQLGGAAPFVRLRGGRRLLVRNRV